MQTTIANWWRARRACGPMRCSPRHAGWGGGRDDAGDDGGGGGFGVRRPLRFLAFKLGLAEPQVAELARILAELKTERAQAEVDRRRTLTAFADAVAADAFDGAKASEGGSQRVQTAERLRVAVLRALEQIHALLDAGQRARLAYLIRSGTLEL